MESAGCKTLLAPSSCDNEGGCRRLYVAVLEVLEVVEVEEVVEVMSVVDAAPAATAHLNPIKYTNISKHKHNQQSTKIFFRMYTFGEL